MMAQKYNPKLDPGTTGTGIYRNMPVEEMPEKRMTYHTVDAQVQQDRYKNMFHSSAKDYLKPLHKSGKKKRTSKSQKKVESAMREVHQNMPSTVQRANVSGTRKEAMLRAIAFAKVRAKGIMVQKRKR